MLSKNSIAIILYGSFNVDGVCKLGEIVNETASHIIPTCAKLLQIGSSLLHQRNHHPTTPPPRLFKLPLLATNPHVLLVHVHC